MPSWSMPPLDAEAAAALAAIEAPSRPAPLAGSRRIGTNRWMTAQTREAVIAAYQAADAPVPAGSSTELQGGVLIVRAPFSSTCVLFSRAPSGCRYSLVPGPTLRITGGGALAPQGAFFCAVGLDSISLDTGSPQTSLFAAPVVGDQPWVVFVAQSIDDDTKAITTTAICLKGTYAELQRASGNGDDTGPAGVPATIVLTAEGASATFMLGGSTVTVEARRTHGLTEALAEAGAFDAPPKPAATLQVTCVTKRTGGTIDTRITAVGGRAGGKPWRLDAAELVARIEAGQPYWIADDSGNPVPIVVATGTSGTKYPKASGDGQNALLHLPKCRAVK